MKNLIFICCILIILFKTGNVLSDNNIFNVNNVEISKEISTNKEKLANQAFKKGFKELINRLLLEDDYKKISTTNLEQIKNIDKRLNKEILELAKLHNSVNSKKSYGGTSFENVKKMINKLKKEIKWKIFF